MKFKAAVLEEVGAPLVIDELEMDPLKPGDVLVRIKASGLCHTDLEVIQGSLAYPMPIVLGHEGAGVVEAVGSGVSRVRSGDHVILSWNPHCGHCFYCERDLPILCEPFTRHQPQGHGIFLRRLSGKAVEMHCIALNSYRLNLLSVSYSHANKNCRIPLGCSLVRRLFHSSLRTVDSRSGG